MVVKSSHAGLHDWIVQRITSIIIGIYALFLVSFILINQPLDFTQWQSLFNQASFKIATIVVLIAILWHAWLGLWTVLTDYIKNTILRLILQSLVIILLLAYVIWSIGILWG